MTLARPANSVADLIVVAGELRADGATLWAAAAMLGLAAAPVPDRPPPLVPLPPLPPPGRVTHAPRPADEDSAAVVRPAGPDPRRPRRPTLVTHPAVAAPPRPLPPPVEQLLPVVDTARLRSRSPEPLLRPSRQRAVLSALAAVGRPGREVDVDTLVERIVVREPVVVVPRLPESTTGLGVQLLVDHGPSMGPFRRDLRLLADAVRLVVGADAVDVLALRDGPRTVLSLNDDDAEDGPYPAPAGPRAVVAASDLGIGDPATTRPADWLWLAGVVRQAGSPLVVLVPYPQDRWPAWADGPLTLAQWDRTTDAGSALRAARRAASLAGVTR